MLLRGKTDVRHKDLVFGLGTSPPGLTAVKRQRALWERRGLQNKHGTAGYLVLGAAAL